MSETSHKLDGRLSKVQVEIVMHLANGLQIDEIAEAMHFSRSNVEKNLMRARRRAHAKTTFHLISIVIGTGVLEWVPTDETRRLKD